MDGCASLQLIVCAAGQSWRLFRLEDDFGVDKGIRVNTVSPGNTYHEGGVWQSIEKDNPELFAFAMGLNPTGRMGTPQETVSSVVFLSSPVSSRTTGANLLIDGVLTRGIQF
jgi:3-oxoacyl-[acyl-carrier protein] reductase